MLLNKIDVSHVKHRNNIPRRASNTYSGTQDQLKARAAASREHKPSLHSSYLSIGRDMNH